jgi:hypothetical protein
LFAFINSSALFYLRTDAMRDATFTCPGKACVNFSRSI